MINITIDTRMVKMINIQKIVLIGLCLALFLGVVFVNDASAVCASHKYIWTADDYGTDPLESTGDYDPCDNWLHWVFAFDRTSKTDDYTIIAYRIYEDTYTVFIRNVDSRLYNPDQHYELSGLENVGSSSQHDLWIMRAGGAGGHFEDIEATADYKAGGID